MNISQIWCRKIHSDGRHNAFTGLARFGGHYYVVFRNAESHRAPRSRILVLRAKATDLDHWEPCASFERDGDLRDPSLRVVKGKLHAMYYYQKGNFVCVSGDGVAWEEPRRMTTDLSEAPPDGGEPGGFWRTWLFHFQNGPDACYTIARIGQFKGGVDRVVLARSEDGFHWKTMHGLEDGLMTAVPPAVSPSEADLAFLKDGTLVVALRTRAEGLLAWSRPPYRDWKGRFTGVPAFGGPALWPTPQGLLLCARDYRRGRLPLTKLWGVRDGHLVSERVVPSGGDSSYAGFADGPNGEVLMSYYSSHEWPCRSIGEGPADIYLARIHLGDEGETTPW